MPGKVDLSAFNNDHYSVGAGIIKRLCWYCTNIIWFRSGFPLYGPKRFLLRLFGARIGKGVLIKPHVSIKYPWKLEIGEHTWIGEQSWLDNLDTLRIGSHVCVSQGALLLCGNHNYKSKTFDLMTGPITLEDGCWIGARAVVTGGVTCGQHSVLTAGSIATKDLQPYGIYRSHNLELVKERQID